MHDRERPTSRTSRLRWILRICGVVLLAHSAHLLWTSHGDSEDSPGALSSLWHAASATGANGTEPAESAASLRVPRAWGPADESPVHESVGEHDGYEQVVTIVQAAIRRRDATYRDHGSEWLLQTLTSIREATPPARPDWQVFVRNATWLESVDCELTADWGSSGVMTGKLSIPWMWDIEPEKVRGKTNSGAAAFLLCPIPDSWVDRMWLNEPSKSSLVPPPGSITVRYFLNMRDSADAVSLPDYELAPRPALPKQKVGVCVAPLFNRFFEPDLVDWLESAALLGLSPVHFYSRSPQITRWLERYQRASGDDHGTARVAPPLSPETYGNDLLLERGLYADQVLYALDCLVRSTWAGPAEWFTFHDIDEIIMPDPFPRTAEQRRTAIGKYLDTLPSDRAYLSIGRTHFSNNDDYVPAFDEPGIPRPARKNEMDARILMLDRIRPPRDNDPSDNGKHIVRVDAVEGQSVHAPTQLFPGFRVYNWEIKSKVRAVHFGISHYTSGPYTRFDWSPGARAFAAAVSARKQRTLSEMHRPPPPSAGWRETFDGWADTYHEAVAAWVPSSSSSVNRV